eukprot:scaffold36047_cov84-Isochrysis_galbana.AAC.1
MNTGGFPKGLAFMLSMLPRWIYRDDETVNVADALRFEAPLGELKARLAKGEKVRAKPAWGGWVEIEEDSNTAKQDTEPRVRTQPAGV